MYTFIANVFLHWYAHVKVCVYTSWDGIDAAPSWSTIFFFAEMLPYDRIPFSFFQCTVKCNVK